MADKVEHVLQNSAIPVSELRGRAASGVGHLGVVSSIPAPAEETFFQNVKDIIGVAYTLAHPARMIEAKCMTYNSIMAT